MSRLRIIGVGSPSGDDQVGWLTIDALIESGLGSDGDVSLDKLDRPGAHLISLLEGSEWVILVDAMSSNTHPGSIRRFDQLDWPGYSQGLSGHGLGVLDALQLARELGSLPARLDLYGVEIGSVRPHDAPGPGMLEAARALARIILDERVARLETL